MAVIYNNFSKY